MPIHVSCPFCGWVPDTIEGGNVTCKGCGSRFSAPLPPANPPPTVPTAETTNAPGAHVRKPKQPRPDAEARTAKLRKRAANKRAQVEAMTEDERRAYKARHDA